MRGALLFLTARPTRRGCRTGGGLCYSRGMRRWLTAALMALCGAWAWATPDAEGAFRLRVGPFFEYGSREGRGMTRLAVRPFFAWEEDRRNPPDRDMEVVWPLSHFGWRGDAFHWRVVMTFWNDEDRTDRLTRDYSLAIPPLWVNGRDGEDAYWGLFPIWGRMPKFLLLEDFRWRLFPLWLSYRTGGTQGVGRTSQFPLGGHAGGGAHVRAVALLLA